MTNIIKTLCHEKAMYTNLSLWDFLKYTRGNLFQNRSTAVRGEGSRGWVRTVKELSKERKKKTHGHSSMIIARRKEGKGGRRRERGD